MDKLKSAVGARLRGHLDDRKVKTWEEVGPTLDSYVLLHGEAFSKGSDQTYSVHRKQSVQTGAGRGKTDPGKQEKVLQDKGYKHSLQKVAEMTGKSGNETSTFSPPDTSGGRSRMTCYLCHQRGHGVRTCPQRPRFPAATGEVSQTGYANAFIGRAGEPELCAKVNLDKEPLVSCVSKSPPVFQDFLRTGTVSQAGSSLPASPVTVLRDTGAEFSCILKSVVPSENCYIGESVLLDTLAGSVRSPLARVYLDCPYVSGEVVLAAVDYLPVRDVHLLLGNDIAGGPVMPLPQVIDTPLLYNNTAQLEADFPNIFPACAVTRSMARKVLPAPGVDESDPLLLSLGVSPLNNVFTNEDSVKAEDVADVDSQGLCGSEEDARPSASSSTPKVESILPSSGCLPVTREDLINQQTSDVELDPLRVQLVDVADLKDHSRCFYLQSGVLMRKFHPPGVPVDHSWRDLHQVVVPRPLRSVVLQLAHDGAAGHLGVRKTKARILCNFFWPGIDSAVRDYCRSCHTCQVVGKPAHRIPVAPLHPIPAVGDPFSHIIIDCVGPLPKTKAGHQYLLTIMDVVTRYPEAMPLRSIRTKPIVKLLIRYFSRVGLPATLQSDQGSNFTSALMKSVLRSLGIRQALSSVFRPQTQGALERWHSTFKTMIRAFCTETGREWDEGIDLLLFAARDTVQESTGCTPFSLVYGHEVRGPLKLLKETWIGGGDEHSRSVTMPTYVFHLQEKLKLARRLASDHLGKVQIQMKERYDRVKKATERHFMKGDEVLVLLPVPKHPLQSQFYGPYTVVEKVGEHNLILSTPDRRRKQRVVHVNQVKLYHRRQEETEVIARGKAQCTVVATSGRDCCEELEDKAPDNLVPTLKNSEILKTFLGTLQELTASEADDVQELVHRYHSLFGDTPTACTGVQHDIRVKDGSSPIRLPPYRMGAEKRQQLRQQIDELLVLGLIQPSSSPWSAPVVMVPKPNGTYRLCIDYRGLNKVTVPDSFPLPRIDDLVDDVGSAKYITTIDLLSGYYQVPLTECSRPTSAFVTPYGLYEWRVMPFGLRNAPATFQRLMNKLVGPLEGVAAYLDDIVVCGRTWEEHRQRLEDLFKVLKEANLTINLSKTTFGRASVTYLGYVVGGGRIAPVDAKVQAVSRFPAPRDKRGVRQFLGLAGYYRRFCRNFAEVAAPLTDLLSSKRKLCGRKSVGPPSTD